MGQTYNETHDFYDLCAEIPTKEFCNVESGAPLVCNKDGKSRLYGMILDAFSGNKDTKTLTFLNHVPFLVLTYK